MKKKDYESLVIGKIFMEWSFLVEDSVLYGCYRNKEIRDTNKIAGFDLDHTIIKPCTHNNECRCSSLIKKKKKRTFPDPDNKYDWEFVFSGVVSKLKDLYEGGFKIIFHTNQSKIKNLKVWQEKVDDIFQAVDIPCEIYVSLGSILYRKPLPTIWLNFVSKTYSKDSFYCGDAAGRKKDFSDTDRKLALNLGISFYVPESIFKGEENIMPDTVSYPISRGKSYGNRTEIELEDKLTMVICVGLPASGKSKFAKTRLKNLVRINLDDLKTKKACAKLADKCLQNKKSIVIDNTNVDLGTREEWIEMGRKYNAYIVVLEFIVPFDVCIHNNIYRHYKSQGSTKLIPTIAYNLLKKKYVEPSFDEDIDEIITIPFCLDTIDSDYFLFMS